jgi:nucleotide-binding universal stress UspA family protein
MSRSILVAVDGSENGYKAMTTLGDLLKDHADLDLILLHCVPQLAGLLPGELVLGLERTSRLSSSDQEQVGRIVFGECRRRLVEKGFPESRIHSRLKAESLDPAEDIQAEASLAEGIRTIAVGRRGRSQLETLLLGSVSNKVALYARHHAVWIVDTPVPDSRRVLIALQGVPDARTLIAYTADFLAPVRGLHYSFLHLMPPVPPTFWDDGHILGPAEQRDRQHRIEKWRAEWQRDIEAVMNEGRSLLGTKGVPEHQVSFVIKQTSEGVARDLLNEIATGHYELAVMGKRSFHQRKPFLMGSHASKILQNAKGVILCLVDDE